MGLGAWEVCTGPMPRIMVCAHHPDLLSTFGRGAHVLTLHWALIIAQAFLFSDLSGETPPQAQTAPRQPGPTQFKAKPLVDPRPGLVGVPGQQAGLPATSFP